VIHSRPQLYNKYHESREIFSHYFSEETTTSIRAFIKEQLEGRLMPNLSEIEAIYDDFSPLFCDLDPQTMDRVDFEKYQLARLEVCHN
jgi:hypothetical protein